MGMMIHRNRKKRKEKQSAIAQTAETPERYVEETPEEQRYTRTDINRMNKDELVSFAVEIGIEDAEETSGADLKRLLIERFGL